MCVTVCVYLSADASGPTECEMEQGGSGFSRDTLQHTHTSLSLCFYLLLSRPAILSSLPSFSSPSPLFPLAFSSPSSSFSPSAPSSLFSPLSLHLFNFLCISPSPLYSAALSLWIKLSLLWSLFFPLLCLYLPFGCRVCAVAWRET